MLNLRGFSHHPCRRVALGTLAAPLSLLQATACRLKRRQMQAVQPCYSLLPPSDAFAVHSIFFLPLTGAKKSFGWALPSVPVPTSSSKEVQRGGRSCFPLFLGGKRRNQKVLLGIFLQPCLKNLRTMEELECIVRTLPAARFAMGYGSGVVSQASVGSVRANLGFLSLFGSHQRHHL